MSAKVIDVGHDIILFNRADRADAKLPCVYCKRATHRVTAFKKQADRDWSIVHCCDGCHDGLRKVATRDDEAPGILRG
jgi:hypothetical protein